MPREGRIDVPECWYHVIARGQRRDTLFVDRVDRLFYLRLLKSTLRKFNARMGAYCLMDNHVHLLIFRREATLGHIFKCINGDYGRYFNRRHRKVGYVFQGRFKSFLVLNDRYLAALLRYIHLNPVEAGIVRFAEDYEWSSDALYRKAVDEDGVFSRVPGFEGVRGSRAYVQLMCQEESRPPFYDRYVGTTQDLSEIDRRRISRKKIVYRDGRRQPTLAQRMREIVDGMSITFETLRSARRTRAVSKARQGIMAKLYAEGFPPTHIARSLNVTPAAVILAHTRMKNA